MKTTNFWPLLLLASVTILFNTADSESDTLVLLHVIFRHGNKTPSKGTLYPTDPYLNDTYEPIGNGQLTTKGKRTEYEIGLYLRQKYGDFIPDQYTPDLVYALSSNLKRTKMSMALVLAGLFPPLDSDIFYEGVNWQPISYNVEEYEKILPLSLFSCANFIRQYYKLVLSEEGRKIRKNYEDICERLTNYTGRDVSSPEVVLEIYETLESEDDLGLKLPDWTADLYPDILEEGAAMYFRFASATPSMRRLVTGPLLQKILDDSFAKREGTLPDDRKLSLYSAHSFHIATLLNTLGLFNNHFPPFGSTLTFEVHNIRGVYGVKLYYQDNPQAKPKLLKIPGCSCFCQLDKFADLVADYIPGEGDVCVFVGELM